MVHSWKACQGLDSARAFLIPRPAERRGMTLERGHLDATLMNLMFADVEYVRVRGVLCGVVQSIRTWRSGFCVWLRELGVMT